MDAHSKGDPIRLVLLDEHSLFRTSLGRLLASEPGFQVAGECATCLAALDVLTTSLVDVVLLDFDLGAEGGIGFISLARNAGYTGLFLVVSAKPDAKNSAAALKLGASGVFLKSESPSRLVEAIRRVARGELWVDPRIIRLLADRYPQYEDRSSGGPLSMREHRVLLGILGGLTNRKIGDNLGVSEGAVKAVVQQLFAKAGVRNRSQLVRIALEGSFGNTPLPMKPAD